MLTLVRRSIHQLLAVWVIHESTRLIARCQTVHSINRHLTHVTTCPIHRFTTPPIHHSTDSPLHHFTDSPFHHSTEITA